MPQERFQLDDINDQVMSNGLIAFLLFTRLVESRTGKNGLSFGEFAVLMILKGYTNEVNLSRVRDDILLLSGASITKIADKLYQKGYITRRENPLSRREKLIQSTPGGEKLLKEVMDEVNGLSGIALKGLSNPDKQKLLKFMKSILANLTELNNSNS